MITTLRAFHRAMRYRFRLDAPELRELLGRVDAGGTAIDIGAHKGAYTWWLRRAVGRGGRVIAVEPQPELARRLEEMYRRDPAVRVRHAAMGGTTGVARLSVRSAGPSHGASIRGFPSGDAARVLEVPLRSLPDLVSEEGLDRLDAIKCDCEGAEIEVFEAAGPVLERFRPTVLVECETRHSPGEADPVGRLHACFAPWGYEAFLVAARGLRPSSEFDPDIHQRYGSGDYANNFLFVPKR